MTNSSTSGGKILKRANPSTIQDKFLVGYQGWFTCPGDGEPVGPGHHGWLHWFNYPIPDGGRPNTDVWPDVSAYSPSELFPAPGLKKQTGEQAFLFSSRNPQTVQRHFHWMAEHSVDGAFLQRFAGQCDLENGNEGIRRIRDEVGDRVREAAEKEGRVFAIMYDVSGVPADRIQRVLERDWTHLLNTKRILDSPAYLHEKGRPVVALWGFGFSDAGHTPSLVRSITQFFQNATPGGAYLFGGAPSGWRTGEGDADNRRTGSAPAEWLDVWLNEFDAISPWTIGRYKTDQEADEFAERKMKGDAEMIKRRNEAAEMAAMRTGARPKKLDYIPVVFPGGSGYNLSEGKWGFNDIKRCGGRFLWKQVFNAKRLGVRTMYGAMWDEYDEGTAFMPIVEHKRHLPQSDNYHFLALDADGFDVPSDWYMRICGFAAEGLRSERRVHETFPVKELQDYWSSRPKYEESVAAAGSSTAGASGSSSNTDGGQTYEEFLEAEKSNKQDEAPPPPYSLEAEEPASVPASVSPGPATVQQPSAAPIQPAATVAIQPISSTPQPARVANQVPNQVPPTAPQAAGAPYGLTAPPPVNTSTYPGYGAPPVPGPSQPHNPAVVTQANVQHQPQDAIGALANEFGRQSISGSSGVGGPELTSGRLSGVAAPPVHPAHPAAGNAAYGRQSRPQSQSGRPVGPYMHGHVRPQSQQGYAPISGGPAAPAAPAAVPVHGQNQPQWPPPEWGVNSAANASPPSGPTHSTYPTHHGHGQGPPPSHPSISGANLSRPQSFSASSYSGGGGGANLRPTASLHAAGAAAQRPPSRPGTATSIHSTPSGSSAYPPSAIAEHLPSSYPSAYPPHPVGGQQPGFSSYTSLASGSGSAHSGGPPAPGFGHGSSPYPQPGGSSYPSSTSPGPSFPTGPTPASSYTPTSIYPGQTGSSYPGQTGSSYPGHQGGPSSYNAPVPHGASSYAAWSGGPPHVSPPQSPPGGASSFPNQSTYLPPPAARPYGSHELPSPALPGGMPDGSGNSSPVLQFPQASDGDASYFASSPGAGGSGSTGNTPGGSSSYVSSYPGQHGPSTSSSPFPGPSYLQPSPAPWMPSGPGGSSMPPGIPQLPSTQGQGPPASSGSSSGPSFPMASTAGYGYAMNVVDKFAGKKTRMQLENQVGSLAKSGSKLYNKFMK